MQCFRSFAFEISIKEPRLEWLLREFRQLVNKSIRVALQQNIRSRARLAQVAYAGFSREHEVYKQYIPSAFEVALGALKAHRRRLAKGRTSSVPYVRKLMLKAENQTYRLDRETGRIRIPVRSREYIDFDLPLTKWHRRYFANPEWSLGSLTLIPGKAIVVLRKQSDRTYEPGTALALDTNEDSLDGAFARGGSAHLVSVSLGGVRRVQDIHFRRRRRIARGKAHDRRVSRRLLAREGGRERNRVRQRLHCVSKKLVDIASIGRMAIVLEELHIQGSGVGSRHGSRRLSSWPRREIHRQIEYKARLAGVPIVKVNPAWTSKTCPVCGARRRDRVGKVFVCLMCDWEMDRQINAGLNILKTALASNEALARAVRFQPGALRHDVVIPLYELPAVLAAAREEPSGVELNSA